MIDDGLLFRAKAFSEGQVFCVILYMYVVLKKLHVVKLCRVSVIDDADTPVLLSFSGGGALCQWL